MLQYSKFVNTKSFQKAGHKKGTVQFPIFSKSVPLRKACAEDELPSGDNSDGQHEQSSLASTKHIHPSIDLDAMQRLEELSKKDQDWLAFFLGSNESKESKEPKEPKERMSQSTELVPLKSHAGNGFADLAAPLMTEASAASVTHSTIALTPETELAESLSSGSLSSEALSSLFPELLPQASCWAANEAKLPLPLAENSASCWAPTQAITELPSPAAPAANAAAALSLATSTTLQGGPMCLNEIFNAMISDDKIFKRACS